VVYLDTHVVVWLYAGMVDRVSDAARSLMEKQALLVSPIVHLELQYLRETGRITVDGSLVLASLRQTIGLEICDQPFALVAAESVGQSWTRDPFDRLIVAQATVRSAPLVTKDRTILERYRRAVW
jgi:PIN domain nuclease of toxin-antitoxin system